MTIHPALSTCAIVPAYKVTRHIVGVVSELLPYVDHVFVIDDACPDHSGRFLTDSLGTQNEQLTVIRLEKNLGVGGAVMAGYQAAQEQGFKILVKVDGDGQMNPSFIPTLIAPLLAGKADYTKGNRFFDPELLQGMPLVRLLGNAGLSFITKLTTGYWHLMDPTNGFTALHADILPWLHTDQIEKRYFFETDVLFRLGLLNAVVQDIPMMSRYADEKSNLSVRKVLFEFGFKHAARLGKRIFYQYFLRDFNLGSLFLIISLPLILFGSSFGLLEWLHSIQTGRAATTGTVMLAAMPTLVGIQLLLSFIALDMSRPAGDPLWKRLSKKPDASLCAPLPFKAGNAP